MIWHNHLRIWLPSRSTDYNNHTVCNKGLLSHLEFTFANEMQLQQLLHNILY